MKDQNSTKKAKKTQRKIVKKEISKSLKDAITKHKKDQHAARFAKPGSKDGSKNGAEKKENKNKEYFKPKSALKKTTNASTPKPDVVKAVKAASTSGKGKWADKHKKSADKIAFKSKDNKSKGASATNFVDRKTFKPNFKLVQKLLFGNNRRVHI